MHNTAFFTYMIGKRSMFFVNEWFGKSKYICTYITITESKIKTLLFVLITPKILS